jgi:hypothetical protein
MIERNLLDQTKDLRPPQRLVQSNFGMEEQRRIGGEQGLSQNERVGGMQQYETMRNLFGVTISHTAVITLQDKIFVVAVFDVSQLGHTR